ncbi:MAG: nuclear transport factor 2 family protein [Actinomycetota bacterium]|nr:nuclear transport factor 2 family protein [Actinomycetota bacterium]
MSEENVELVRQVYEAWNRGDLQWMLDRVTPDFEFRTTHLFPDTDDIYQGREGLKRFWNTFQGPWEILLIEVERIEPIGGDRVLALFQFHGRGRDGLEVTLEYAHLFTFENGMAALLVGFANWQEALEAVGLRE